MLNVIRHDSSGGALPLVISHGLYGSARNWGAVARALSDRGSVLVLDHRNHGLSPWQDRHRYPDLAQDLVEMIATEVTGPVDLLGHSMGGKAAMVLALTRPEILRRLIVVDIAPVAYTHSQIRYVRNMQGIDLSGRPRRSEVEEQLQAALNDKMLAGFFSQSYDATTGTWRLNLDTLAKDMPHILGFPDFETSFDGPTLFLSGAKSDYVRRDYRDAMKRLFPAARFVKIPEAGHWVHAERPDAFIAAVRQWLDR